MPIAIKYDSYKNSDSEWLGEIPSSWPMVLLSQIVTQVKNKNSALSEKNLLSLSYGRIKRKPIDTSGGLLPASFDGYNIIEVNDIVLRLTDLQNDHTSLRVGLSQERGIITSAYTTMRPKNSRGAKYLYYLLHTFDIRKGFYGMGSGVRQGLNYDEVKRLKLPLPTEEEQIAIAKFLDDRIAHIDSVIAEAKSSIEEYKAWKASIIYEAVTKGLDPDVEMKDSGISAIGTIPAHWSRAKIRYLHNGLTDGTHGTYNRVLEGRYLLSSKNVREDELLITDSESFISEDDYKQITANGFPRKNDLLLCCIGASIGRCIVYELDETMAFQRSVIFIRPNALITSQMLRYAMISNSTLIQEKLLINQSAQPGLYQGSVGDIFVALPPISEQNEIVQFLDKRSRYINQIIKEKEQLIIELEAYKKSLIFEAVTGKRKVV